MKTLAQLEKEVEVLQAEYDAMPIKERFYARGALARVQRERNSAKLQEMIKAAAIKRGIVID